MEDDNKLWDSDKVLANLCQARTDLKEAQREHKENRDTDLKKDLDEKEKKARESDDPKAAKKAAAAVEMLIQKNQMQESYLRIKYIFKPGLGGGLQRVNIPKQDDKGNVMKDGNGNEIQEVLLDANDIHKAILERNKKHFHQATDTPFGGSPNDSVLFDLVGYSRMNTAAKEIVEGTFLTTYGNNLELLPETEQLIKELAMPEEIKVLGKKISYKVTEADFISGFKGWKECTSTSPLGHHLGHYKAMINDPDGKKKPELHGHMMDFVDLW